MQHLEGLNEQQKKAVLHTEGPLLIIAGAGAGKTKTLTHRILHIIKSGVAPEEILAITFTNKAAKEMRERVKHLLQHDTEAAITDQAGLPFLSTFHSLGVFVIREWHHALDLPKRFSIYDRDDSKKAVREAVKACNLDPKQYEPGKILNVISREKGNMRTVEEFAANVGNEYFARIVADVWEKYEATLKKERSLDFDDLLLKTALLLRKEEVRKHYAKKWRYIHVDEYQDTNKVQYEIARHLAAEHRNICVVGDADQTIYTWRGATIDNILTFERDYPEAETILLEQNYRSTKTILSAANAIIEKNKKRQKKTLFTDSDHGDKITLYTGFDENDEARFIADSVKKLVKSGVSPKEIAVLYRANFQSRVLEQAFLEKGVNYQVLGTRFFDRKEVKDILSYIRYAINQDSSADLTRIINEPARGIGKVTLLKILEGKESELTGSTAEKVQNFRKIIADIEKAVFTEKASEVIKVVMRRAGFEQELLTQGEEGMERLANIKELVTLAVKFDFMFPSEGIESLLTDAALATDQDSLEKDNGGVKLMTVHASKGLEFDYVFVSGLEEGLFPHDAMNERKDDDEEERRLFYVAVTRARKKLFLTHAHMRTIFGNKDVKLPSSFLDDIADEHLEMDQRNREPDREDRVRQIFIDF